MPVEPALNVPSDGVVAAELPSPLLPRVRLVPPGICEKTCLVLPHNANHHGNLFGGNTMEWALQVRVIMFVCLLFLPNGPCASSSAHSWQVNA